MVFASRLTEAGDVPQSPNMAHQHLTPTLKMQIASEFRRECAGLAKDGTMVHVVALSIGERYGNIGAERVIQIAEDFPEQK